MVSDGLFQRLEHTFHVFEPSFRIATKQVDVFIDTHFYAQEIFVHPRFETLKTSHNHMSEFVIGTVLLFLDHFSHRRALAKSVKSDPRENQVSSSSHFARAGR